MNRLTLQEHYNLIKEGKGNKMVFMRESKRAYPQHIRNAANFDETVTSLLQNHIIFENLKPSKEVKEVDFMKIFKEKITENQEVKYEHGDRKSYNPNDKDNLDNINPNQFALGFMVEKDCPKNKSKTIQEVEAIVHKNLKKDPLFYVKDGVGGIKGIGYRDDLPGLTVSKPLKGKYVSSGYGDLKESKCRLNENVNRYSINSSRAESIVRKTSNIVDNNPDSKFISDYSKILGDIDSYEELSPKQWGDIEDLINKFELGGDFESEDEKEEYYLDLDDVNESKNSISLVKLFGYSDKLKK